MRTEGSRAPGRRRRPVRATRLIVAALVATVATVATMLGGTATPVNAHDDIEGSTPASRSTIDEPISMVEIDFGEVIDADNTSLFVEYGLPDNETETIESTTTVTGPTTAIAEFDEITRKGTYFVRYLAPVPADGHVIAGSISFSWGAPTAIVDTNPDIRLSTPGSRDVIDDPITSADIEFEIEITDLQMELIYDQGDGETFDTLGGEVEQTGPTTATFRWDELPQEGTYFMSYTASAVADGDEVAGAIPFIWGSASGTSSGGFPWVLFIPVSLVALAIGAFFSRRRMLVDANDDEAGDDAVDDSVGEDPELSSV